MKVYVVLGLTNGEFGHELFPAKVADTGKRAKAMAFNLIRKGKAMAASVAMVELESSKLVTFSASDVPEIKPRKARTIPGHGEIPPTQGNPKREKGK